MSDTETIYEAIRRAEDMLGKNSENLSDIFASNPRLIISPNNVCNKNCFHCVADSNPNGITMDYDKFIKINPEFIKLFSYVDFGRRGNPLFYLSKGKNLADLMGFLNNRGINDFTLALAIQAEEHSAIGRLEDFSKKEINIETMITYHHYVHKLKPKSLELSNNLPVLILDHPKNPTNKLHTKVWGAQEDFYDFKNPDTVKLAEDFNKTIKNYLKFSRKIIISLLGDNYSQQNPTKAKEVENAFIDNWNIIFSDIPLDKDDCGRYYTCFNKRKIDIAIPSIDTRVYPLGRFRQYLEERGILKDYEKEFESSMSEYTCPDMLKWPGIIIEPNGDLNLCASFEAINCKNAVVSNIFEKSFEEVKKDLLDLHERERKWFMENLDDIVKGRISTCKLKNRCYK